MITISISSGSDQRTPISEFKALNTETKLYAAIFNNTFINLNDCIANSGTLKLIDSNSELLSTTVNNSAAHLLAQMIFSKYADSTVINVEADESGFHVDIHNTEHRVSHNDVSMLETEWHALASSGLPIILNTKHYIDIEPQLSTLQKDQLNSSESYSVYTQAKYSCINKAPVLSNSKLIKGFRILSVSGAYLNNDKDEVMLQRIYGVSALNKKTVEDLIIKIEDAAKRDHRKLAKTLDLFHIEETSPGMVFWHPKGWTIWQLVEKYIRSELTLANYQEIKTPSLMDQDLWVKSGHWDNFKSNMFITSSEKRVMAIKPMNCPGHVRVFNNTPKSYKDLPLRFSEFGSCCRNESSGSLQGLMRVRAFVQDDAHIFCTHEQVKQEVIDFINLLLKVYKHFGFNDISIALALRPDQRLGSDETWDASEQALRSALEEMGLDFIILNNEGAFYGPKIEFHIKDCLDRKWQCGTVQLDFILPERLNAKFVDANNSFQTPVMIHRAILGSMERFIGILIEHYSGLMPFWLAPEQVSLISITEQETTYAASVSKKLIKDGFRVKEDYRNLTLSYKIRESIIQKIPYLIILGSRESKNNNLSIRSYGSKVVSNISYDDLINLFNNEIK